MVKIRLTRLGTHKRPFYRVIVADSRCPRDGRNIEQVGYYNPLTEPKTIKLDLSRIDYWTSVGAQQSETVARLVKTYRASEASASAESA
jgi:small subunit ribosomal protein S16